MFISVFQRIMLPIALCIMMDGCAAYVRNTNNLAPIYIYHNFPPFIINDTDRGDLTELFTQVVAEISSENWKIIPISRIELNTRLERGEEAAILWANTKWFPQVTGLSASSPILWDSDLFVSLKGRPLDSTVPQSLFGKRFCAIEGHVYLHLEPWLTNGSIQRVDSKGFEQCRSWLLEKDVDFMQIERSSFYNLFSSEEQGQMFILGSPVDTFTRHILLTPGYRHMLPAIDRLIIELKNNPKWIKGLQEFGGDKFMDLFDLKLHQLLKIQLM